MKITYLEDDNLLKVEADEIATFITGIVDYLSVKVIPTKNSATLPYQSYNTTEVLNTTSKFYIANNILYIKPSLFSLSTFEDNIYKLNISFFKTNSWTTIETCIFVDINYKCKVAKYLENIIEENRVVSSEKVSTIVHLLHYGLVNGSNCGCNCVEMVDVFNELKDLISATEPVNTDCGC